MKNMQINLNGKFFEIEIFKKSNKSPNSLPILVLHGFPDKASSWRKTAQYLAELGHEVVVPSLRGYNPSYSPEAVADYDLNLLSDDILGLLSHLKIEKVMIIGHDWGGILAWHFAHLYPNRIERLVVISVPHPITFKKLLSRDPRQWVKSWYIFFFQLPVFGEYFLAKNNFKLLKEAINKGLYKYHFSDEDLLEFEKSWKNSHQLKTMIHWYRALKINFDTSVYHQLDVPVLQIVGSEDPFFVANAFSEQCLLVKQMETTKIADCGHWPQFENPNELISAITDFFKKEEESPLSHS